jgi:hypothetical protein
MKDLDATIRQLRESIENAKQLKRDLELKISDLSKLIESAEALRDRGMRVISGSASDE